MKTLKFRPELVAKILSGEKTNTWRLFDEKDLQPGDEVEMVNWETHERFGTARLTSVKIKTLGTLAPEDFVGHTTYPSDEAMYADFRKYYGDRVSADTEVKVIDFEFKPNL